MDPSTALDRQGSDAGEDSQSSASASGQRSRPPRRGEVVRVEVLEAWEGTVVAIDRGDVVARLRDRADPAREEWLATFALDAIADDDRSLVATGAVFYGSAGYEVLRDGRKRLVVELRFRRVPAWSAREIRRLAAEVGELDDLFSDPPGLPPGRR